MFCKNVISKWAVAAFLAPSAVFAADASSQSIAAQSSEFAPFVENESDSEAFRLSLGVEAFHGIATNDVAAAERYTGKIEGIDLYGANLRVGAEFPTLFGVDWLVPEVFVLAGYGQGEDDAVIINHANSGGRLYAKDDYTSKLYHASAGVALNFEVAEGFALSVSGRLGYGKSKFKLEETYEMDFGKDTETQSANFSETESDGGLIYGIGAGAHWRFADHHQISLGVEWSETTAQPELKEHSGRDLPTKLEKQGYVFFSLGYRFVF